MTDSDGLVLVISTVESAVDAEQLAKSLVQHSWAACVQWDGPITSHYRWKDKLQRSEEYRLLIKSSKKMWPTLKQELQKLHPYDEPEIIMIPILDSNQGYRNWVISQIDTPR